MPRQERSSPVPYRRGASQCGRGFLPLSFAFAARLTRAKAVQLKVERGLEKVLIIQFLMRKDSMTGNQIRTCDQGK
jgi:hypothetical protein